MFRLKLIFAPLVLVLLVLITALPLHAQAVTITETEVHTLGSVRTYDCIDEFIELSGEYRTLFHVTFTPTGGTHTIGHSNSSGVSGVGLTTGTRYTAVDGERRTTNIFGAPGLGFETTFIDTFRLIGAGTAPDLLVFVTIHTTLTPNGDFQTHIVETTAECD
jgi:hypothetical protein